MPKQLSEQMAKLLNERNLDGVTALVDANIHFRNPAVEGRGVQQYRGILNRILEVYPDLSYEIETVIAEGDRFVVVAIERGTNAGRSLVPGLPPPAPGRKVEFPYLYRWSIAVGSVFEAEVCDRVGIYMQLGLLLSPGSVPLGQRA